MVHGDDEAQAALSEALDEKFGIPVEIPMRGDVYEADMYRISKVGEMKSPNEYKFVRLEILQKMENLRDELEEMTKLVNDDLKNDVTDKRANEIADKLKELEKQIVEVIK